MTIQTLMLADFLFARVTEDMTIARACSAEFVKNGEWTVGYDGESIENVAPVVWGIFSEHIARHDPARVVRECEVKQRLIEMHSRDTVYCAFCRMADSEGCRTLRILALAYADHPDYREEWRP